MRVSRGTPPVFHGSAPPMLLWFGRHRPIMDDAPSCQHPLCFLEARPLCDPRLSIALSKGSSGPPQTVYEASLELSWETHLPCCCGLVDPDPPCQEHFPGETSGVFWRLALQVFRGSPSNGSANLIVRAPPDRSRGPPSGFPGRRPSPVTPSWSTPTHHVRSTLLLEPQMFTGGSPSM